MIIRRRYGKNNSAAVNIIHLQKEKTFTKSGDYSAGRRCGKTPHAQTERTTMNMNVRRGDIYYADLSPVVGSEQGGVRPVLIVQNDVGNRFSPTVIAAAITSQTDKSHLPTHIYVHSMECGLHKDSVVLLEQIRTLDKRRLKECMGRLEDSTMDKVDHAISVSFGLGTSAK